ncbi:MAG: CMP-2-keto-3-deoxyoctulosonic acid synthetase [Raoultibacter sp.]
MALRKYTKTRQRTALFAGSIACFAVALCVCVGVGASFAGAGGVNTAGFGLGDSVASDEATQATSFGTASDANARENTQLANAAQRDISKGLEAIEVKEESDRVAAEEAARVENEARIAAAAEKIAEQQAVAPPAVNLSEVDWTVGKEAFIAEWTTRIDAYLAGSPLAGQGVTFATAAWENSVDPRWSPAISNTESSKGAVCFMSYNAWGWGKSGFSSWEEAINTHVAGLSSGYGYTISYAYAQKYCPPNYDHWFNSTLSEMQKI